MDEGEDEGAKEAAHKLKWMYIIFSIKSFNLSPNAVLVMY